MVKIIISIAIGMSLFSSVHAGSTSIETITRGSPYYIYAMEGVHIQNIESKSVPGYTIVPDALEDTGVAGEMGVGYKISNKIFAEFAYQYQNLAQNDTHNLYVSLNYNFLKNSDRYTPYLGMLAGYSSRHWVEDPTSWNIFDRDSSSALYGAQLGLDVKLNKKASLRLKYQAVKLSHVLDVFEAEDAIEDTFSQTFMIGIKYEF